MSSTMVPPSAPPMPARVHIFRVVRIVLIIGVFLLVDYFLLQYLSKVRSHNAFINGNLYGIHTPIQGRLNLAPLEIGQAVKQGQTLGWVKNPRGADLHLRQSDLTAQEEATLSELLGVSSQIREHQRLLGEFGAKSKLQRSTRLAYEHETIQQAVENTSEMKAALDQATSDAKRYMALAAQGYAPKAMAEKYEAEAKQKEAQYKASLAKQQEGQAKYKAAQGGVQVDSALATPYPDVRRDQLRLELLQLQQQAKTLQVQRQLLQKKKQLADQQLALMASEPIIAPASGVIWTLDSLNGEEVAQNALLFNLLDCQKLWVDAYIEESDLKKIDLNAPVELNLISNGKEQAVKGKIMSVRSGLGRYSVSQSAIAPPDPKSKSMVLVKIALPPSIRFSAKQSCGVGMAVDVSFPKQ